MALRAIVLFCCVLLQIQVFSQVSAQDGSTTEATPDKCRPENCGPADNRTCVNDYCVCISGTHVPDKDNTQCYPVSSEFGESCDISPQCSSVLGDGAACLNGICGCQNGFLQNGTKCVLAINELGGGCKDEVSVCYLEDDGTNQNVECSGDVCACKDGYTASANQRQCKKLVGKGEKCSAETICTVNAECVEEKCVCKADASEIGNECKRALGDTCTDTSNCAHTANADCVSGVCSCVNTHTPNSENNKCYPLSPQHGSPCEIDPQCNNLGDGAMCSKGHCSCQDGFHIAGAICLFVIDKLGNKCNTDTQLCYLEDDGNYQNVYCSSYCYCNRGFTASSDKRRCIANLGTACVVNSTCPENGECVESQCRCNSESVGSVYNCKKVIGAEEQCDYGDICTSNSYCSDSRCKCYYGYRKDEKLCVRGSGAKTSVSTLCTLLAAIISLGLHHWR